MLFAVMPQMLFYSLLPVKSKYNGINPTSTGRDGGVNPSFLVLFLLIFERMRILNWNVLTFLK